jgi:3-methyladenine DNA glycosylase AlkD
MKYLEVLKKLKSQANPKNVKGMALFGINPKKTLGVSVHNLRKMAKEIGKDHLLALQLWKPDIHEARILASMIDDPLLVNEKQMELWVKDFDS